VSVCCCLFVLGLMGEVATNNGVWIVAPGENGGVAELLFEDAGGVVGSNGKEMSWSGNSSRFEFPDGGGVRGSYTVREGFSGVRGSDRGFTARCELRIGDMEAFASAGTLWPGSVDRELLLPIPQPATSIGAIRNGLGGRLCKLERCYSADRRFIFDM
jgi:hypothetical protein